jgi:rubrerythrin
MAAESRNETTKKVLLRVADEEKGHLALLGRYLDAQNLDVLARPLGE